jgi:hypothetical protein
MPNEMKPPLYSKPYSILMTLLIILGTLRIVIAFVYLA